MIFPEHCKYVAVRAYDKLSKPSSGEPIYCTTHYLLLLHKEKAAIYEIRSEGQGLIKTISSANKIADFSETLVSQRKVDIFNRGKLIKNAARLCKGSIKAAVYQGFDLHWTFVYEPNVDSLIEIEVFDIIPPKPPYLVSLIKRLDNTGVFGDLAVSFKPILCDLRETNLATIYPCSASGIGFNHLNCRDIQIAEENILLGCDISRQVLEERYEELKFEHINLCPTKSIRPHGPFIAKCCQSTREGPIELSGQRGYIVHWGANAYEIVFAVRSLAASLCQSADRTQSS